MKTIYKSVAVLFILITFFSESYSQCTPRVLPFMEDFFGTPLAACTPLDGGWTTTSAASGADWWIPSPITNYAGGQAPEIEAYGDQANGGVSETIRLTSPPMNTTSMSALTLSFKHNLYLHNSAASGGDYISLNVETSSDLVTWTSVYMDGYNATGSLSSVVNETRTVPVSVVSSDSLYFRFSITGVLFKVWGWEIDDITLVDNSTSVPEINEIGISVFTDHAHEMISVKVPGTNQNHVLLCDLTGKIIYQTLMNDDKLNIDTKSFAEGLYVVRVQNDSGVVTKKINIE